MKKTAKQTVKKTVKTKKSDEKKTSTEKSCSPKLVRFISEVRPNIRKDLPVFSGDFCLTDIVVDQVSVLENNDREFCSILLTKKGGVTSETLFQLRIDDQGRQIHLTSGIVCSENTYLTLLLGYYNPRPGRAASLFVTMTGYYL